MIEVRKMGTSTEQIWEAFHTPLQQFIRRRVPDDPTAEDLLQEVFLKIHQHIGGLKDARQLESWLYRLTRNVIIDYYRTVHPTMSLESVGDLALPEELPVDDIVSELLPSVRAMVYNLPPPDRQALVLTQYHGLTQKELGERMGLSISGAKSRVQRARERLKQQLLDCCHFELDRRGHILDYQPRCDCCAPGRSCAHSRSIGQTHIECLAASFSDQLRLYERQDPHDWSIGLPGSCESEPVQRKDIMSSIPKSAEKLREEVRARYSKTARRVLDTAPVDDASCCGPSCCSPSAAAAPERVEASSAARSCCATDTIDAKDITSDLYTQMELGEIPVAAALASLGCGNPTALAELRSGERVLDLGSGGGIDVLLSTRRVGPTGFAYGLDMTDEMLELAEKNRREAGIENVKFLKGIIEAIPLPDNSVDVVISNCVINLSADKGQVLREAYRVLAPEGRFAVSDIVVQGELPPALRQNMESWAGCVAGALEEETYRSLLHDAGFVDVDVEVTRRYNADEIAATGAAGTLVGLPEEQNVADGQLVSAFVRARKPVLP
jgi:arsenite methyltransferase